MTTTQYPLIRREEEHSIRKDVVRFMIVAGSISQKLERAERMLSDLGHPLKAAALFAHYCSALKQMPITQSEFDVYCINPRTGKPFDMFAGRPVFPDGFGPAIESLGTRLGNVYADGILPVLRQARGAA
jgi:hypothetical protein